MTMGEYGSGGGEEEAARQFEQQLAAQEAEKAAASPGEEEATAQLKAEQEKLADQETIQRRKGEYIALAQELVDAKEGFPFPGMNPDSYARRKAQDQEYPGYSTDTDALVARFEAEGMKVVLGSDPKSGTVYILPKGSNSIEDDALFPRQLALSPELTEQLQRLIQGGIEQEQRKGFN